MFICTTKYKIQIIKSCFIRKNSGFSNSRRDGAPVPLRINRFEMDTVKHKYPQYYAMVYMPIAEHLNSIVSIRIPMIQACSCQSQDDTFSIPLHPSNHL